MVSNILCWTSLIHSPFSAHKFCKHALILSAHWNTSGHNQTIFFLYSPFVNVYLETRIISVGEIFRELWIVLNILCWTCVIHSPFSAHKFCKQALKRSLKYFGPHQTLFFFCILRLLTFTLLETRIISVREIDELVGLNIVPANFIENLLPPRQKQQSENSDE